jgi:histidinol-phosphatase (PHP family)
VTFTDHFDWHPDEEPLCKYDYDGLARAAADLRKRYDGQIVIGHGIEVCWQPEQMERILVFLRPKRFDLVILSVHWTQGRAMHVREHWSEWNIAVATRAYLQTVAEAVEYAGKLAREGRKMFDVLGHLDMVKRYTQWFRGGFDVTAHADLVDRILRGCLDGGMVPEVNTSGMRQGVNEPMPAAWIVRRYVELGGTVMSLGSDAHKPEHIAANFDQAIQMLKDNGIRQLAIFKDRKMTLEPLD